MQFRQSLVFLYAAVRLQPDTRMKTMMLNLGLAALGGVV
jgi:hypothetical protein